MVSCRRQIYSTVYEDTLKKITFKRLSQKLKGKPLPLGAFVLKQNFSHVLFSDKLKQLRIGPNKILEDSLMLHMNSSHKMVLHWFIEPS